MKKIYFTVIMTISAGLLHGCGDSPEPVVDKKETSHVWQSQTDALKEAQSTADDLSKQLQLREDNSRPTD